MKIKFKFDFLKNYSAVFGAIILLLVIVLIFKDDLTKIINEKEFSDQLETHKTVKMIIIGVDEQKRDELLSLYMVYFEPVTKRMSIIYFPSNSLLLSMKSGIENHTVKQIFKQEGLTGLNKSLEYFFKNDIPYYIIADKEDFIHFVDIIEGININVVRDIQYIKNDLSEFYYIKKGYQLLLGPKLFEYVSFEKDSIEEISKIFRQSKFVKSLIEKIQNNKQGIIHESIIKYLFKNLYKTNLRIDDIKKILLILNEIRPYDVIIDKVPGKYITKGKEKNKTKFYEPNGIQTLNLLPPSYKEIIEGYNKDKNITVQILNGTNTSGLASKMRNQLQPYIDIDVLEIGNAAEKGNAVTTIIDRRGNFRSAQRIKEIIGLGKIKTEKIKDNFYDITIIIGNDSVSKLH